MIFEKRYLQFNNLVFDGYDMISDYDSEISFKGSSQEYSYGHGSYRPFKNSYLYVSESSVTMTISLHLKKIPCEYRAYYTRFAEEELNKPGRLWAIKNNEIIWAFAVVTNMSQIISMKRNEVVYDIEFTIPGGVWNKADKQKTFVLPYDSCLFMECKGYKTLQPCKQLSCEDGDCCQECLDSKFDNVEDDKCFCCCVDQILPEMALCYNMDEKTMQSFYSCDTPYQLVYDCDHAEKFNIKEKHLGQKLCVEDICDDSVIAGRFYSETDIPTEDVTIIIDGKSVNPWIEINGNTNIINGEYDGTLIVKSNGDVYYQTSECCEPTLLDPSVWEVPSGNTYGWTVNPRGNSIIIHLNACCSANGRTCAYIQHQAITM